MDEMIAAVAGILVDVRGNATAVCHARMLQKQIECFIGRWIPKVLGAAP